MVSHIIPASYHPRCFLAAHGCLSTGGDGTATSTVAVAATAVPIAGRAVKGTAGAEA
jgi:hypothetical protein